VTDLLSGLAKYFIFYNSERFHQSLGYKTPDEAYLSGTGGGAKIVLIRKILQPNQISAIIRRILTPNKIT
jgi:hypothetical protein